ncbi:hypothetical protein FACS189449_10430 [Alphaproteobacteria bacterium]|nr:hypothetical protein FACS189449_10430 [Alphaproteobacteria bacterium]
MELHDIKSHMSSQIREATSLVQKEYDLSQTHLNRAFWVLENRDSHKELIPMFRQVYTLIIQHKPLLMCTATYSFLTNVNKFKGAECLAGYKNRIIVDLLRCITD